VAVEPIALLEELNTKSPSDGRGNTPHCVAGKYVRKSQVQRNSEEHAVHMSKRPVINFEVTDKYATIHDSQSFVAQLAHT
jgi:hypothetical protein